MSNLKTKWTRIFKTMVLSVTAAVVLLAASRTEAQVQLKIATRPTGPDLMVVLAWSEAPAAVQFNVYRKTDQTTPYPATPLNTQPIGILSDAQDITALIPPDSDEWHLLQAVLADPPGVTPFDPLSVSTIPLGSEKYARLQLLARVHWRIAVLIGQAYVDHTVTAGQHYLYELRGVDTTGREIGALASGITIAAGVVTPIPAPTGLIAQAGDSKVLLLWDDVDGATGFNVYREIAPGAPYQQVNEVSFTARIATDLEGNAIAPDGSSRNGFVDFQRWDTAGNPTTHLVEGVNVVGPANGFTYHYRVASLDLLGQQGPMSDPPIWATPLDLTPPKVPRGLTVIADEPGNRLELRWLPVTRNSDGHPEVALAGYRIYRYENPVDPVELAVPLGGLIPQPPSGATHVTAADPDPSLRSSFGEKIYWYRVQAVDAEGNVSALSAAISGYLKDTTPPNPPAGVSAEGFEELIQIHWKLSDESDMDGYLVYRSICHLGEWRPCPEKKREEETDRQVCGSPFVFVGTVTQDDAKASLSGVLGAPHFEDRTVPAGSPLCYAYLVKAQDRSQNKSGSWPVPDLSAESLVCERLRDKTPPEPAIISGLSARDGAVSVEWIGPPVQDIGAYHVYRSRSEGGMYAWVGGATVPLPPASPVSLVAPYAPISVGCATIPQVTQEQMSIGSLLDPVDPKQIYWYRVVGVDQVGNEAPVDSAVPISSFSFSQKPPATPSIIAVISSSSGNGLFVSWTPAFNPSLHLGFLVYRSRSITGPYRQIGTLMIADGYLDAAVAEGVDYWYRVARLDSKGELSELSPPKSGRITP